jgi:hypothetical protein
MLGGMSSRMRQRLHLQHKQRLEAKRQSILMAMDPEARVEYADATLADLIVLRQTGRLNMLPGIHPDDED